MVSVDNRKIFLRADADAKIGYGHFMRTLALAEMISDKYDCVFATQSPSEFQKDCLKDVCKLWELPPVDSRFQLFADSVKKNDIVILDNYFYNSEYENYLRSKGASVVLIDNLHARHSCADAIIGFSLGLKKSDYSVEPYTKLFLGPSYSLLRKPFIEQLQIKHKPIDRPDGLNVVVSFGGADVNGIAFSIADLLEKIERVSHVTIIGNSFKSFRKNPKVELKSRLSAVEMRDAFVLNDIAILPTSTTTLEALSCGIPIIGGYVINNQIDNYNKYIKAKAIIGCGDLTKKVNQQRIKDIIESRIVDGFGNGKCLIPSNIRQNLLSIFETM